MFPLPFTLSAPASAAPLAIPTTSTRTSTSPSSATRTKMTLRSQCFWTRRFGMPTKLTRGSGLGIMWEHMRCTFACIRM
ncbi:hypothetical protein KSP40_PGU016101 [Platanthera guangdongensis]|uniref:Secreted protein n=1 Tax=Platanthera guangdongensis TaxID=2320717 RepID=A0ABR2LHE0_9ASPA